jgi:hypothetical protein
VRIVVRHAGDLCNTKPTWRNYRVAARGLVADVALRELVAFKESGPRSEAHLPAAMPSVDPAGSPVIYSGTGWVGGGWHHVECRSAQGTYWLAITGVGPLTIAVDTEESAQIAMDSGRPGRLQAQAVLGPALVLALALQRTWCLHASAVAFGGQPLAFLGESADGKSTLAAFLGAGHDPEWRLLADDLLPVAAAPDGGSILALPHFPQLKLPMDRQPAPSLPEQMPMEAIYVLGMPPHGEQDTIEIEPLSRRDALVTLVRHTMAGCLFDRDLAAQNLAFAADVASRVPIRRLAYPRRYEILPRVRDALAADLQTL